jgi:hypothetical protein
VAAGLVLVPMLAVIGVTIIWLRQLIVVHLFVGLVLIGPVLLKTATTGYRFARYYTGEPEYRRRGPPELALRLIAPIVVASTIVVFVTGVLLLLEGPHRRGLLLPLHKISFIVWIVFTGLHVLGHLPLISRSMAPAGARARLWGAGDVGRRIALVGVIVGGVVLAVALIGHYGGWTAPGVFHHQHRG